MVRSSLEARGAALHGDFDRDRVPVLRVDPGDVVRVSTLDAWWSAGPFPGGHLPLRPRVPEYTPQAGHALTGPIFVRGARPGMTLAVRMHSVLPGPWGTTAAGGWPSPHNRTYRIENERAAVCR